MFVHNRYPEASNISRDDDWEDGQKHRKRHKPKHKNADAIVDNFVPTSKTLGAERLVEMPEKSSNAMKH